MGNIECFGDRDDEYIDEEGDTEMVMLLNGEEVPVSEYNEETDKNNAIFMFRVGSATLTKRAVSEEKFKSEVQTITDDSWVLPERTKSVVYKDSRQINLERLKSYFNDDSSSDEEDDLSDIDEEEVQVEEYDENENEKEEIETKNKNNNNDNNNKEDVEMSNFVNNENKSNSPTPISNITTTQK